MPLRYSLSRTPAQIAVWKVEEDENDMWKQVQLSTAEVQYLQRISHPRRRLESLAARAALTTLRTHYSYLFYSLSHSFPWAAAAIAPHPIAIDLEKHRPFPKKVLPYFTQPTEQEMISNKIITPWHVWCAKEVSYKLLCNEFREVSFKRELVFDGKQVVFIRGPIRRYIWIDFIEEVEWLLAVGSFA